MKKSLFFALIACVTLVFVGCEPQNDPNKLTGITVSPNELSMVPGDEFQLDVVAVPAAATLDSAVVWASSDTTVAVVSANGLVTAVGYGKANITATSGEYSAACAVWVKTYLESLQFTQAIMWSVDTLAYGDSVYEITTSDGSETFNCYMAEAMLRVFSDGMYVNESGYIDGVEVGSFVEVYAPMFYGTSYLNPEKGGVQFVLGNWQIAELPADSLDDKVGAPGKLDEAAYIAYMDYALQAYNAGEASMFSTYLMLAGGYPYPGMPVSITGATLNTLEYDVDETGEGGYYSSYIPDGIVTGGQFTLSKDNPASAYMCSVDYSQIEFLPLLNDAIYAWGCYWIFNEDGTISWGDDKLVHWGEKIISTFGEAPVEESIKMEPMHLPVMTIDHPEIAERIDQQLKVNNSAFVKK